MTKEKPRRQPLSAAAIRRRAEEQIDRQQAGDRLTVDASELHQIVHELQVHQIELEMQNDELQQARAEIEAGLDRYTDLYDFAPVGYFSLGPRGEILEANLTGAALLGVERSRLVNTRLGAHLAQESLPAFNAFLDRVFARPGKTACEVALRNGWEQASHLLIEGGLTESGQECRVAVTNITERKQAEAALLRSQKLESLSMLAGGIAHDFNSLLLIIAGNAKLALADLAPDHPTRECLTEIDQASGRAASLVRQILAFGRHQEQEYQVVPLQPVVEEALRLLRVTLPPSIRLETDFTAAMPPVSCDVSQVREAVVNLVTNASQAITASGGKGGANRIDVSIDVLENTAETARNIAGLRAGRYVRLSVKDDGLGIDPDTQQRIFDPFFTTRPFGQGAGLGLSVVHGIMLSHGGAVTVNSQPGKGSTFHLYFPVARAVEAGRPAEEQLAAPGHGERVLFVDDEEPLVFLISRALKRLGYTVLGYTDPGAALEFFQTQPYSCDVVVTDLSMPGRSGFDLARAIWAVRPDVPIVMTTGYIRSEDQAVAAQLGIRDVILKPNTVDELGRVLDGLFRRIPKAAR